MRNGKGTEWLGAGTRQDHRHMFSPWQSHGTALDGNTAAVLSCATAARYICQSYALVAIRLCVQTHASYSSQKFVLPSTVLTSTVLRYTCSREYCTHDYCIHEFTLSRLYLRALFHLVVYSLVMVLMSLSTNEQKCAYQRVTTPSLRIKGEPFLRFVKTLF